MANIARAYASSHAFTFMPPDDWNKFRAKNRQSFIDRIGREPRTPPGLSAEPVQQLEERHRRIRGEVAAIRSSASDAGLDALVIIGDDQNENLSSANMPQLAIYTGDDFRTGGHFARGDATYKSHRELASHIAEFGVARSFDIATLGSLADGTLTSHAHAQILDEVFSGMDIPVVIVFMNAIHHPAISPARCYQFGRMLSEAIGDWRPDEKVGLYASGGLSHYTAGYPWHAYEGDLDYGDIDVKFDEWIIDELSAGHGESLAELTTDDLLMHGEVELRAWIALVGAIGNVKATSIVYEPFYHAIMGMAVARWDLEH